METEKVAVLFNPSAGKGRALRKKSLLETLFRKYDIPFDLFITKSEGDLIKLTEEGINKYKILIGAGGDSTFNIMVNVITRAKGKNDFGMIGIGSSNDITREFSIESMEKACLAIKQKKMKKTDLGCIIENDSVLGYFLGQVNIGLGVHVNKYVKDLSAKKPLLGKRQTLAGILGILNAYRSKKIPIPLSIKTQTETIQGLLISAVFSNIRYWASGKLINPGARPDDGILDCCLITNCSLAGLNRVYSLAGKGLHTKLKQIRILRSEIFEISSELPFAIQNDGEIFKQDGQEKKFNKVCLRLIPKAINIIHH
jgi:diacylglycerol kinase family enzyme